MFCLFGNLTGWPAVAVTVLIVGLAITLGALILSGGPRRRPPGVECPECGHANPPNARYCARCGRELKQP
jgi:hypothetical protein